MGLGTAWGRTVFGTSVLAVCNDVTVAAENFRVCGSFGAVPLPGRVQVMPPGVTVAIEKCPRKVSKDMLFGRLWGPGGTPTPKTQFSKNGRLPPGPKVTILGPFWVAQGGPWEPGFGTWAPSGATLHVPVHEKGCLGGGLGDTPEKGCAKVTKERRLEH